MTDWHRRRVDAAARALAAARPEEADHRRAQAAIHAADDAVGGVVPRQEYEQLALDYSAMRVRALQDEDLLERALEALDRIAGAGGGVSAELQAVAFGTAVEVRAMLDARSEHQADEGL
jgi:hypothetical protein